MLLTMIKKDLRVYIKDFQFQVMFLLCLVLFVVTGFQSAQRWKASQKEFQDNVSNVQVQNLKFTDNMMRVLQNCLIYYLDEPNEADQITRKLGYPTGFHTQVTVNQIRRYDVRYGSELFFQLDWLYIIGVLGSLMALLFSYDVISREKQNGTFRLLIVEGVSRFQVLLSKYLAIFLLFSLAMLPGILLGVLLFSVLTGVISISLMLKYLIFLLICTPYISFFILLGLLISTGKNYRNNIIVTMTLWLLFVILIPESSTILAKQIKKLKTASEYDQEIMQARGQMYDKWYEIAGGDRVNFNTVAGNTDLRDGLRAKAFQGMDEIGAQIYNKQNKEIFRQKELILTLSSFSPFGLLDNMTNIITGSGYFRFRNIMNQLTQQQAYVESKIKAIDNRDPKSLHLFYSQAMSDSDTLTPHGLVAFTTQKYPDPQDLIISHYQEDHWKKKITGILNSLLILLGMNALLWVILAVKMKNYDVR